MKLRLTLIGVVILSWFPMGWAQAANLLYARAGEHGSFTRIVFEFQDVVQAKKPVITDKGKFYLVFLDSSTTLPRQTLNKTTKGVNAVEFIQRKSHLTTNITLAFPYFRLKTFSLPNPDRFVIDAYRTSPRPKEIVKKEPAPTEPIARVFKEPAPSKQITDTKKSSAEVAKSTSEIEPKTPKTPALDVSQRRVEKEPVIQVQPASQVPAKQDESPPSFYGNYNVPTYLLILLNFSTVIIIALLSFNLLRRRPTIDSDQFDEILDSLKTTDESIAAIDVMINKELKKLDHS